MVAATELNLDVRGLPPCEPMERILAGSDRLAPGQRLRALVSREPLPLFPLLGQRGFDWRVVALAEGRCELLIWRAADLQAAAGDE
ncbi:MAG: DUF2249 domain-containing protein [Xanthomonadaceae bacterium]|jgi:uncharacterized protein (DUF2249 family)|nr:DUF2249 domain-containing protein [Xanthomonadaceae bacterium]MDE3071123.1 DUF2249 domain-containing protein [Pseudomonadota bacterium]